MNKSYYLVLASASPARLKTLENAGLSPEVRPADVDEDTLLAEMRATGTPPAGQVLGLARAKAQKIASELTTVHTLDSSQPAKADTTASGMAPHEPAATSQTPHRIIESPEGEKDVRNRPPMTPHEPVTEAAITGERATIVVGCDSMLEFGGQVLGKPHSPEIALARVQALSGASGVLHTGHWVVLLDSASRGASRVDAAFGGAGLFEADSRGAIPQSSLNSLKLDIPGARQAGATESTTVRFADFSEAEAAAYVDSGEPLEVAGSFTIDGLGGAFIRGIEGDPHNVVGISLPCLRCLLTELGVFWPDLWA